MNRQARLVIETAGARGEAAPRGGELDAAHAAAAVARILDRERGERLIGGKRVRRQGIADRIAVAELLRPAVEGLPCDAPHLVAVGTHGEITNRRRGGVLVESGGAGLRVARRGRLPRRTRMDRRSRGRRYPEPQAAQEVVGVDHAVEAGEVRTVNGEARLVIESTGAGGEAPAVGRRELDPPHAAVAVAGVLDAERHERLARSEAERRQVVAGGAVVAERELGAVETLPSDAAHLVAVGSDAQVPDERRSRMLVEGMGTRLRVAAFAGAHQRPHRRHREGRRRDPEAEAVEEIVGVEHAVETEQVGAEDAEARLVIEAVGSRDEMPAQRRRELDPAYAAMSVAGVLDRHRHQRLTGSERVRRQRVGPARVVAERLARAVEVLPRNAAHLVAVRPDADVADGRGRRMPGKRRGARLRHAGFLRLERGVDQRDHIPRIRDPQTEAVEKVVHVHGAEKAQQHGPLHRQAQLVIEPVLPGTEGAPVAGRELDSADAAVSVRRALDRERAQRFVWRKRVRRERVAGGVVVPEGGAIAVEGLPLDAADLVPVPAHAEVSHRPGRGVVIEGGGPGGEIADAVALDHRVDRGQQPRIVRRRNPEAEAADEIVRVDPAIGADQKRPEYRTIQFMVEAISAGGEAAALRCGELDAPQAAGAVARVPEDQRRQRLTGLEDVGRQGIGDRVVVAELHASPFERLPTDAADLVAVPSNAQKPDRRSGGMFVERRLRGGRIAGRPGLKNRLDSGQAGILRRRGPDAETAQEIVGVHHAVKAEQVGPLNGKVRLVIESVGSGGEASALGCRELDAPHAAVAVARVLDDERRQRFGRIKGIGRQGVLDRIEVAALELGVVETLPADAANLVAVPTDAQRADRHVIRMTVERRRAGGGISGDFRFDGVLDLREPWIIRRGDRNTETADETIGVDPAAEPHQVGTQDREIQLVIEAGGAGLESAPRRGRERDPAEAAMAVAGVLQDHRDERFAGSEGVGRERVVGRIGVAGLETGGVEALPLEPAHLVAVPTHAQITNRRRGRMPAEDRPTRAAADLAGIDDRTDSRQAGVLRRRGPDAEAVEEVVGVDHPEEAQHVGAADGEIHLMVEAISAGDEATALGRRELDPPHAAVTVAGLLDHHRDQRFPRIERV